MKPKNPLFRLSLPALISLGLAIAFSDSAAEMTVKPLEPGGAEITFTLQQPGQVSLAVYGPGERLLRTLLSARPLGVGRHAVSWDGLDRDGTPQPPGDCAVKLLKTDGLRSELAAQVGINPVPFWEEGIGNHAPTVAIAVDPDGIILIPNISEGGFDLGKIRPDRSYAWSGYNVNQSTFAHVFALAGQTATTRVRNSFGWGHNACAAAIVDGIAYILRNNAEIFGTDGATDRMLGERLWSAQWDDDPDEIDRGGVRVSLENMDMDAFGGTMVISYRRHDAVRFYDLKTRKLKNEVQGIEQPLGVTVDAQGNALVVTEGAIVRIKDGRPAPFIPAEACAAHPSEQPAGPAAEDGGDPRMAGRLIPVRSEHAQTATADGMIAHFRFDESHPLLAAARSAPPFTAPSTARRRGSPPAPARPCGSTAECAPSCPSCACPTPTARSPSGSRPPPRPPAWPA